MDASYGYGGSGGGNVAQTLMTLEQKIEAMEKDVKRMCIYILLGCFRCYPGSFTHHTHFIHSFIAPHHTTERLQAVAAAEREGAALKEELAQCRELRQALLKRWHEARIAYDEVRWCRLRALAQSILPSLPHTPTPTYTGPAPAPRDAGPHGRRLQGHQGRAAHPRPARPARAPAVHRRRQQRAGGGGEWGGGWLVGWLVGWSTE